MPGLAGASDAFAAGASPAAALALEAGLGSDVAKATDLVLAVAIFAGLIGFLNYGARFAATVGADGVLPSRVTYVHPRFASPTVAIVGLAVLGLVSILALLIISGNAIPDVYASIATLIVYFWVVPYLLISVGVVVLLWRERAPYAFVLLTSLVGSAAMAWLYINGLVNPPPAPADAMAWVFVAATVVACALLYTLDRRARRH